MISLLIALGQTQAEAAGARVGLVVGVSRFYGINDTKDLPWVIPTQATLTRWLQDDQDVNVGKPILDVGATGAEVLAAIAEKSKGLGVGDSFVFVLHTHGYLGSDGQAGFMMNSQNGLNIMTAKEVGRAIRPALARGVAVTLIMETCHSGGTLATPLVEAQGVWPSIPARAVGVAAGSVEDISSEIRNNAKQTDVPKALELPPVTTTRQSDEPTGTLTILSACKPEELSWMSDLANGGHFSVELAAIVGKDRSTPWVKIMPQVRTAVEQKYGALIRRAAKTRGWPNAEDLTQTPIVRGADTTPFEALQALPALTIGQFQDDYEKLAAEDFGTFDLWAERDGKRISPTDQIYVSPSPSAPKEGAVFELLAKASVPGWLFTLDRDGTITQVRTTKFVTPGPKTTAAWLSGARITAGERISFGLKRANRVGTQQIVGIFFRDEAAARTFANHITSAAMVDTASLFDEQEPQVPTRTVFTSLVEFKVVEREGNGGSALTFARQEEEGIDFGDFSSNADASKASPGNFNGLSGKLLIGAVRSVETLSGRLTLPGSDQDVERVTTGLFSSFKASNVRKGAERITKQAMLSAIRAFSRGKTDLGVIYISAPGTILPDGTPGLVFEDSKPGDASTFLPLSELQALLATKKDTRLLLILDASFSPEGQTPSGRPESIASKFVPMFPEARLNKPAPFAENPGFEYLAPGDGYLAVGAGIGGSAFTEFLFDLAKPFLAKAIEWVLGRLGVRDGVRQQLVSIAKDLVINIVNRGGDSTKETWKQLFPKLLDGILNSDQGLVRKFMAFWKFVGNPSTSPDLMLTPTSTKGHYRIGDNEELALTLKKPAYVFLINVDLKGAISLLRPKGASGDPAEITRSAEEIVERAHIADPSSVTRVNRIGLRTGGVESMIGLSISDPSTARAFVELLQKGAKMSVQAGFRVVQEWLVRQAFRGSRSDIRVVVRNLVVA